MNRRVIPSKFIHPKLTEIDHTMRQLVGARLVKEIQADVQAGSAFRKLATAT